MQRGSKHKPSSIKKMRQTQLANWARIAMAKAVLVASEVKPEDLPISTKEENK